MTTGEIHGAFNAFWSKYWLRDQVCETESDEAWKSFVDQVEPSGFPQYPDIHVSLESTALWMKAIQGLKSGKAHGVDGWRYEEIKKTS